MMSLPVGMLSTVGVGTCSAHKRTKAAIVMLNSGAMSVITNGVPTATIATVGVSSCGHTSVALTMSARVLAEGMGVHRGGDLGCVPGGIYILNGGSLNTLAG